MSGQEAGSPRRGQAWPVRGVALVTLTYSAGITVAPKVLATPCGLTDWRGRVPRKHAGLIRSIGLRDATLAALLVVAPTGRAMTGVTAARVLSDAADAVWFASFVPARQRTKIAGAAVGWALLELAVDSAFNRAEPSG